MRLEWMGRRILVGALLMVGMGIFGCSGGSAEPRPIAEPYPIAEQAMRSMVEVRSYNLELGTRATAR